MASDVQRALDMSKENTLILQYSGKDLSSGQSVPKQDAPKPPALKWTGTEQGPFIAISLDLDAPFPSASFLSPILHWIQPGLQATTGGELTSQAQNLASWVQPAPPPLSGPHRYIVLLYKQPASFNGEAFLKAHGGSLGLAKRFRWDQAAFTKKYGLTDLAGANYFVSK